MLHPLMPFITEELWNANERPYELIVAKWPEPAADVDFEAKSDLTWLVELITEIRSVRSEMNVPPAAKTELWLEAPQAIKNLGLRVATVVPDTTIRRLQKFGPAVARMARCTIVQVLNTGQAFELESRLTIDRTKHLVDVNGAASLVVQGDSFLLPLQDVIDVNAERDRLLKVATAVEKERDSLAARLANPNFTERAKPEAVEKARADHDAKAAEAERLRAALERLG
jgi:valyl-tRNA synthetase